MRALLGLVLSLALCGCRGGSTVRIGVKGFAEQRLVAAVVRHLMVVRHGERANVIDCGDTFGCHQALASGRIDVITEYSGTAALYLGLDPGAGAPAIAEAYATQGLVWGGAYGFDNGYLVVVAPGFAQTLEAENISALTHVEDGVRITCPRTYLRRPRDGLAALVERYGLRRRGEALVIDDPTSRLEALRNGRADVAIVYGTDGVLAATEVVALKDDLGFFPAYEAAPLARQMALSENAALSDSLQALTGRLDQRTIVELNAKVSQRGWHPRDAARFFLAEAGLTEGAAETRRRILLPVAVDEHDRLPSERAVAEKAIRRVFSERAIELSPVDDVATAIARGEARLALLGAERFFRVTRRGLQRSRTLEAVAVVGSRSVHLVRGAASSPADALTGRIGVPPRKSGAAQIATALLRAHGRSPAQFAPAPALLQAVRSGALDGALVVGARGMTELVAAMNEGGLTMMSLPRLPRSEIPFLRPARLPAKTYPGQDEPLETFSAQVLLAGPSRAAPQTGLRGGPAAAMLVEAAPLTLEQVQLLSAATGVAELPDPVLPVAWTSLVDAAADESHAVLDTVLNGLTLAFCGWLLFLLFRREYDSTDHEGSDHRARSDR